MARPSNVPLYRRLAQVLRRELEVRADRRREPFPTEAALGKRFGVSRVTVRQALRILEDQGLIFRNQGRGTFVAPPKLVRHLHPLVTFEEDMARQGIELVTEVEVFEKTQRIPRWARERLGGRGKPGGVHVVLRRVIGGLGVCHDERYLTGRAADALSASGLAETSTREMLQAKLELLLTHLGHETEVIPASDAVAHALKIRPGTPVLVNVYTSYAEGMPIEVGRACYRVDRFRFSFGERQWNT